MYKPLICIFSLILVTLETRAQLVALTGGVSIRRVLFPGREDGGTFLSEGSECTTSKGNDGICIPITSCPSLRGTFLFKLPVVCRWKDLEPVVCCPEDGASEGAKGPDPRWREGKKIESEDQNPRQGQTENLQSLHVQGCGRTLIPPGGLDPPRRDSISQRFSSGLQPFLDLVPGARKGVPHFVVGGLEALPHAWPWMAAIYIRNPAGGQSDGRFLCGGSLIDTRYVLTAAHCFASRKGSENPSNYLIRLGAHNVKDGKSFEVDEVTVHEQYRKGQYYHDIALLRLRRDVRFNHEISPVCLPRETENEDEIVGRNATVTGWGDVAFGGVSSKVLREATIPIVSQETCDRNYSRVSRLTFPRGISDQQICAGVSEGGKDACQGDSGGPLVMEDPQTRLYHIVGIVSFGFRCATPGFPGIYTNVSAYLNWIAQQTGGLRAS